MLTVLNATEPCRALQREDLLTDERFIGNTARTAHRHALDKILEEAFATHMAEHWVAHLSAADVPCAMVQDYHTALTQDPQIRHNRTVIEIEHPRVGTVKNIASPVNFYGSPATYRRPPPVLGEHTSEVLTEFGFSDEEIAALESRRVADAGGGS
ncbi:CoA transferase [Paraburkholderia sp. D1E]|uniref:CoA transferase n=1 Tax=Paraburkholderia sp. D1E TaxID=3461398 RepID=UPI004045F44E